MHTRPACVVTSVVSLPVAGHQLQQEHLHAANHRHDRLAPVPRHAATIDNQGARVHPRLLGVFEAELGGAAGHLEFDQGAQGPGNRADSRHAGRQ